MNYKLHFLKERDFLMKFCMCYIVMTDITGSIHYRRTSIIAIIKIKEIDVKKPVLDPCKIDFHYS